MLRRCHGADALVGEIEALTGTLGDGSAAIARARQIGDEQMRATALHSILLRIPAAGEEAAEPKTTQEAAELETAKAGITTR